MAFTRFDPKPLRTREQIAREVHAVSLKRGLDELATVIALMTISVEVGTGTGNNRQWWCPANRRVAATFNYPHDSESDDNRSSGYFQQQPGPNGEPWWGTPEQMMTLPQAANTFLERLTGNWRQAANNPALAGQFAQQVQRSAYPDRYAQRWDEAWEVLRRALATGDTSTPTPSPQVTPWRGDPVWLPDVLRAEGLECDIHPGAFNRGHGDFGEIWGVMAHHTGSNPPSNNPGYIAQHPQLGLASQLHLSRTGKYTLCGVGIAWHAGNGSYPGLPTNNANRYTIGIEAENNGVEGWSEAQYSAYVKGVAAILRRLGHNSSRLIGHKEWAGKAQGKWDPGGIDMNNMRRDVQTRIGLGAINPDTLEEVLMSDELFPSRSTYRTNNDKIMTARDALFNIDSMAHRQLVEDSALRGEPWAVRAVEAVARGEGPGAKLWYDQTKPDTWAIEHAKAILAQVPK